MKFLKCTIYLATIGLLSFIIGRCLPKNIFNENLFPYKSLDWEKEGTIYTKLKIKKWQNILPDMSKIVPQFITQKKMSHDFKDNLPLMITETCIAEFIHFILCIAGLYCLSIWEGLGGLVMSTLNFFANLLYIIIQRYNRPRLLKLKNKLI